jgi:pyruvate formate lyase activating enzyme
VVDGADDKVRINWDLASECGEETTSLCPTEALYLFGKRMTVDEVWRKSKRTAASIARGAAGSR